MNGVEVPKLNPENPQDVPGILTMLVKKITELESSFENLSKKIDNAEKRRAQWFPQTLSQWIFIVLAVSSAFFGIYKFITYKDHEQDVHIQKILSQISEKIIEKN